MPSCRLVIGVVSLVLVLPAASAAQPEPSGQPPVGALVGVVTDLYGTVVPNPRLRLVSLSGYRFDALGATDGVYRFDSLAASAYRLRVFARGYADAALDVVVASGGPTTVDVRLTPARPAGLLVRVLDPQGLAVPGAAVSAVGPARAPVLGVSGTGGLVRFAGLQPGAWSVEAVLDGFGTAAGSAVVPFGGDGALDLSLGFDYAVSETVVVVGSRRVEAIRSVVDSAVPVDVLPSTVLAAQGRSDTLALLRSLVPSFNVNMQPISDAATVVRPVNLRNLAPDHLLVLVNGKRRHRSAVIAWLGNGIADGSQGPDLSLVPAIAIRQVELLRDGAAAQYGSDAIAGVVNFELKDARRGGSVEITSGLWADGNAGDPATCHPSSACAAIGGRSGAAAVAANVGLPLGNAGFANLSLEYGGSSPTNRASQRDDAAALGPLGLAPARDTAQVWGAPRVADDLKTFAHFGTTLPSGLRPYGHMNYASRRVEGGMYYRQPLTTGGIFAGPVVDGRSTLLVGDRAWARSGRAGAGGCPVVALVAGVPDSRAVDAVGADPDCFTFYSRFPAGLTPQFGARLLDHSVVAGLRAVGRGGLTWDASVNVGRSRIDQSIVGTLNPSLGLDSPTAFDPGSYDQQETNLNFDIARPLGSRLHVAAGAERRVERFTVLPGDPDSWAIGPYADQGFSSGSHGFNGYRPEGTAGRWLRGSAAVYGDAELHGVAADPWSLGAALRLEQFDDFGATLNGKLAARYPFASWAAVRAAVSTGFRAPTPGQKHAFNVSTAYVDGALVNTGVVSPDSAAAAARGGGPLRPETSLNHSAGVVVRAGPAVLAADWFRVAVDDRLALSGDFRIRPDEVALLLAAGSAEAANFPVYRFFLNDFSTLTDGLDLSFSTRHRGVDLLLVFNHTRTRVGEVGSPVQRELRVQMLERGLPATRWHAAATVPAGAWSVLARLAWFGSYWDSEDARNAFALGAVDAPTSYPAYSGKALVDLQASFPVSDRVTLAVGVDNLLNVYPDVNLLAQRTVGNRYGQFSPFGFNGAYAYARVSYAWGGAGPG